jgi:RNA-directed DNA polymerase
MSEDAPVNIGAVAWPDPNSAYVAVRSMQTKLHRWAGEDSSRRFGDLFNLVYDPAFLVHAWERVSNNRGARTPGVDKVTVAMVETWVGVEAFLDTIRASLKSGEFRPVDVRQVMIPKANGRLRKLGIPTVADRVVQASLKLVLEPIFERISNRARMGSARTDAPMTRSPTSTTWPPSPATIAGCWRQTSRPVSTRSTTRP